MESRAAAGRLPEARARWGFRAGTPGYAGVSPAFAFPSVPPPGRRDAGVPGSVPGDAGRAVRRSAIRLGNAGVRRGVRGPAGSSSIRTAPPPAGREAASRNRGPMVMRHRRGSRSRLRQSRGAMAALPRAGGGGGGGSRETDEPFDARRLVRPAAASVHPVALLPEMAGEGDDRHPILLGDAEVGDDGDPEPGLDVALDRPPSGGLHRDVDLDAEPAGRQLSHLPGLRPGGRHDRGVGGDLLQIHGFAPGQRVAQGGDESHVVEGYPVAVDAGQVQLRPAEEEILLTGAKKPLRLADDAAHDTEPDVGITVPEPADDSGQHEGCPAFPGDDADHPRDTLLPRGKGLVQAVHGFHHGHGDPVEALAGLGKGDTRAVPLEQPDPELRLQRTNLLRHGRLAEAKVLGRPGDAPQPCHVAEHPELLQAIPLVVMTPPVGRHPRDSTVKFGSMSPINLLAASDRRSAARMNTP